MSKVCSKCKIEKDDSEFSKRSLSRDGLRSQCKTCSRLEHKRYNLLNRDKAKKYRESHRDHLKIVMQDWYLANKNSVIAKVGEYQRKRLKNDINFRLRRILRTRLYKAFTKNVKVGSAIRDLGCSIGELKLYLEKLFQPGMTWENYGKWHIDHIVPLVSFDLTDREQFLKACHFSNLQPLWAKDNLSKGAR